LTAELFSDNFAQKDDHAMRRDSTKKPSATANEPSELDEQIRLRAHELYEARGKTAGHELEDWLRAEEEIAIKKFRTATA
jgi:Protein of unknown function (DUF2934)